MWHFTSGAHSFKKHRALLHRIIDSSSLVSLVNLGKSWLAASAIRLHDDVSDELFERILDGIFESDQTPQGVVDYLTAG